MFLIKLDHFENLQKNEEDFLKKQILTFLRVSHQIIQNNNFDNLNKSFFLKKNPYFASCWSEDESF